MLYSGRSAASGLPCAGAAPPQRPLQNHLSPTVCILRNVSAGEHGGGCTPVTSQRAWMVPRMTGWSSTVA